MQYKLKQATLENRAGDIFTEQEINGQTMLVPPSGDIARAIPLASMTPTALEQFFEAIEVNPDRAFVPAIGEKYFFMNSRGAILDTTNGGTVDDAARVKLGNAFKTESAAALSIKFLEARSELITSPLNQFKPDWANGFQEVEYEVPDGTETKQVEREVNGETVVEEVTTPKFKIEKRLEPIIVAWYIAFNKTANRYLAVPAMGNIAPPAIAFYETEVLATEAYINQKANYKAYFGGYNDRDQRAVRSEEQRRHHSDQAL